MARDTTKTTSGSSSDTNSAKSTEELQQQIEQLKQDMASIAATLADIGSQKIEQAQDAASDAYKTMYEQGEEFVTSVKQQACTIEDQVTDYVQERPLSALAIAAGIGYIFAALTRR